MYEKLYHTVTEEIGVRVIGFNNYESVKNCLESKGFKLVKTSKLYELSNIITMTFKKELDMTTLNKNYDQL